MKTIAKFAIPASAIIMAVAGAFSTNSARENDRALVDRTGYIKVNPTTCVVTSITCSTDFNSQMCSDGSNILHDWNGSSCPLPLYRKVN